MFCDHYSLVSTSLTQRQLDTCVSYYQNAFHQPWYTSLVTAVPILLGAIVMVKNIRRSVYDILSIPAFVGVVAIFIIQIKKNIQELATKPQSSLGAKEYNLKQIANSHVIIGVLLVLILILQILAGRTTKNTKTKSS